MLGLFLFIFSFFQSIEAQTVHYRIKPIEAVDRTNLEISLNYQTKKNDAVTVKLPIDCYGTPNLSRFVTSFRGESETIVKDGKDEGERIVEPNSKGEIHLKYVLSFEPKMGGTYSPNVDRDYFHVAGCQWMLRIGKPEEKLPHIIELIDAPKDWKLYSSLSANPSRFEGKISFQDLMITVIGGGRQGFSQFTVRKKPVSVFVQGKFAIPQHEILAAVRKIVTLQRERFDDFNQPFYNIVILPKENNVAGTRIENLFVSFLKSDVTRDQLYVLLSHEMLHNWLTSEIIKPPEGELGLKYQWFYEGFTDYFSRKILLEAGLLSKQKFVELINRDIINVADNPNKSTTYQDLVEATKTGKFGQAFNKLSYYRGALIALNWDTKIRQNNKTKSLGNLIEDVHRLSQKNGSISEAAFFELVQKNYRIDAKADFERYILRGEPIFVASNALGNSYKLIESSVPSFDAGFSLNESLRADKIIGLKPDSVAFQAGLRDGMLIVNIENYNRFSNAWNPSSPMIVVIKEQNKERNISFFPHGEAHKLLLFQEKISFITNIFAQPPANSKQVNLDLSALAPFWEIYEILAADKEPSDEQWDALFAKTGYATLEKRERRRKVLTEAMRIAYLPSKKTERDEILQNKSAYLKITVPNLLEVPKYRQESERFMQKENIQKIYLQAKKAAQEFLPAGTIKRFPPPPIAFIYFGNARGYDPMLFDPLYLMNHGNKIGMMGHEIHHYYRKFVARESQPFGEDMLPWAIVNVENEGIPGRVDKAEIPKMSLAKLEKVYLDKQTFDYFKDYQTIYANSNEWLKFSEKILEEIADNPSQYSELGKKLHRELPDNGRAMGTFMSEIIEKQFGRQKLNNLVGDAFNFWLTYNQAAKLSKGKGYILSDKAIKVIENTRDKYQK